MDVLPKPVWLMLLCAPLVIVMIVTTAAAATVTSLACNPSKNQHVIKPSTSSNTIYLLSNCDCSSAGLAVFLTPDSSMTSFQNVTLRIDNCTDVWFAMYDVNANGLQLDIRNVTITRSSGCTFSNFCGNASVVNIRNSAITSLSLIVDGLIVVNGIAPLINVLNTSLESSDITLSRAFRNTTSSWQTLTFIYFQNTMCLNTRLVLEHLIIVSQNGVNIALLTTQWKQNSSVTVRNVSGTTGGAGGYTAIAVHVLFALSSVVDSTLTVTNCTWSSVPTGPPLTVSVSLGSTDFTDSIAVFDGITWDFTSTSSTGVTMGIFIDSAKWTRSYLSVNNTVTSSTSEPWLLVLSSFTLLASTVVVNSGSMTVSGSQTTTSTSRYLVSLQSGSVLSNSSRLFVSGCTCSSSVGLLTVLLTTISSSSSLGLYNCTVDAAASTVPAVNFDSVTITTNSTVAVSYSTLVLSNSRSVVVGFYNLLVVRHSSVALQGNVIRGGSLSTVSSVVVWDGCSIESFSNVSMTESTISALGSGGGLMIKNTNFLDSSAAMLRNLVVSAPRSYSIILDSLRLQYSTIQLLPPTDAAMDIGNGGLLLIKGTSMSYSIFTMQPTSNSGGGLQWNTADLWSNSVINVTSCSLFSQSQIIISSISLLNRSLIANSNASPAILVSLVIVNDGSAIRVLGGAISWCSTGIALQNATVANQSTIQVDGWQIINFDDGPDSLNPSIILTGLNVSWQSHLVINKVTISSPLVGFFNLTIALAASDLNITSGSSLCVAHLDAAMNPLVSGFAAILMQSSSQLTGNGSALTVSGVALRSTWSQSTVSLIRWRISDGASVLFDNITIYRQSSSSILEQSSLIMYRCSVSSWSSVILNRIGSTNNSSINPVTIQETNVTYGSLVSVTNSTVRGIVGLSVIHCVLSNGSVLALSDSTFLSAQDTIQVNATLIERSSSIVISGCILYPARLKPITPASYAGGFALVSNTIVNDGSSVVIRGTLFMSDGVATITAAFRIVSGSTLNAAVVRLEGTCGYINPNTFSILDSAVLQNGSVLILAGSSATSSSMTVVSGSCFVVNGSTMIQDSSILIFDWSLEKLVTYANGARVLRIENASLINGSVTFSSSNGGGTSRVVWWGPIVHLINVVATEASQLIVANQSSWMNRDVTSGYPTVMFQTTSWSGSSNAVVSGVNAQQDAVQFIILDNASMSDYASLQVLNVSITFTYIDPALGSTLVVGAILAIRSQFSTSASIVVKYVLFSSLQQNLLSVQNTVLRSAVQVVVADAVGMSMWSDILSAFFFMSSSIVEDYVSIVLKNLSYPVGGQNYMNGLMLNNGVTVSSSSSIIVEKCFVWGIRLRGPQLLFQTNSTLWIHNSTLGGPLGCTTQPDVHFVGGSRLVLDFIVASGLLLYVNQSTVESSSIVVRNGSTKTRLVNNDVGVMLTGAFMNHSILDIGNLSCIPGNTSVLACVFIMHTTLEMSNVSITEVTTPSGTTRAAVRVYSSTMTNHAVLYVRRVSTTCTAFLFDVSTVSDSQCIVAEVSATCSSATTTNQRFSVQFVSLTAERSDFSITSVRSIAVSSAVFITLCNVSDSSIVSGFHDIQRSLLNGILLQRSTFVDSIVVAAHNCTITSSKGSGVLLSDINFQGGSLLVVSNSSLHLSNTAVQMQNSMLHSTEFTMCRSSVVFARSVSVLYQTAVVNTTAAFLIASIATTLRNSDAALILILSNVTDSSVVNFVQSSTVDGSAGSTVVEAIQSTVTESLVQTSPQVPSSASNMTCGADSCVWWSECSVTLSTIHLLSSTITIQSSFVGVGVFWSSDNATDSRIVLVIPSSCNASGEILFIQQAVSGNTTWNVSGIVRRCGAGMLISDTVFVADSTFLSHSVFHMKNLSVLQCNGALLAAVGAIWDTSDLIVQNVDFAATNMSSTLSVFLFLDNASQMVNSTMFALNCSVLAAAGILTLKASVASSYVRVYNVHGMAAFTGMLVRGNLSDGSVVDIINCSFGFAANAFGADVATPSGLQISGSLDSVDIVVHGSMFFSLNTNPSIGVIAIILAQATVVNSNISFQGCTLNISHSNMHCVSATAVVSGGGFLIHSTAELDASHIDLVGNTLIRGVLERGGVQLIPTTANRASSVNIANTTVTVDPSGCSSIIVTTKILTGTAYSFKIGPQSPSTGVRASISISIRDCTLSDDSLYLTKTAFLFVTHGASTVFIDNVSHCHLQSSSAASTKSGIVINFTDSNVGQDAAVATSIIVTRSVFLSQAASCVAVVGDLSTSPPVSSTITLQSTVCKLERASSPLSASPVFLVNTSGVQRSPSSLVINMDNMTIINYTTVMAVEEPQTMAVRSFIHLNMYCSVRLNDFSNHTLSYRDLAAVRPFVTVFPYSKAVPSFNCPTALWQRSTLTSSHLVTHTQQGTLSDDESSTTRTKTETVLLTDTAHLTSTNTLPLSTDLFTSSPPGAAGTSAASAAALATSLFGGAAGDAAALAALSMLTCGGKPNWGSNISPQRWILSVAYDAGPVTAMFVNLCIAFCVFSVQWVMVVVKRRRELSKRPAKLDEPRAIHAQVRFPSLANMVFCFVFPGVTFAIGHAFDVFLITTIVAVVVAACIAGAMVYAAQTHFRRHVAPVVSSATVHAEPYTLSPAMLRVIYPVLPHAVWLPRLSCKADASFFVVVRDEGAFWTLPWLQYYGAVFSFVAALPFHNDNCVAQFVILIAWAIMPMALVLWQSLTLYRRPLLNHFAVATQVLVLCVLTSTALFFLGSTSFRSVASRIGDVSGILLAILSVAKIVYSVVVRVAERFLVRRINPSEVHFEATSAVANNSFRVDETSKKQELTTQLDVQFRKERSRLDRDIAATVLMVTSTSTSASKDGVKDVAWTLDMLIQRICLEQRRRDN